MEIFKHGCVTLTIDIHGTSKQPLFSTDQVATALCLEDVEERMKSFESGEVTLCGNVPFLTGVGVRRLSGDGRSPYSSAFGKWAVEVAENRARGSGTVKPGDRFAMKCDDGSRRSLVGWNRDECFDGSRRSLCHWR